MAKSHQEILNEAFKPEQSPYSPDLSEEAAGDLYHPKPKLYNIVPIPEWISEGVSAGRLSLLDVKEWVAKAGEVTAASSEPIPEGPTEG